MNDIDGIADMPDDLGAFNRPRKPVALVTVHVENCPKCRGTGRFVGYTGFSLGACFKCQGTGKLEFKAPANVRARNRANASARKARNLQEIRDAFAVEHRDVIEWCQRRAGTFDFATAMDEALAKYGELTEGQVNAVRRCIVGDQERAERKARETAERDAAAPRVSDLQLSKVQMAFDSARENGIKYPRMRLATFTFSPASATSRNPGAIYVKAGRGEDDAGTYLGKIMGGKFLKSRDCSPAQEADIVTAASDPLAAAIAYGQQFGQCSICGRELTNKESIDRGIGPICAEKFGW